MRKRILSLIMILIFILSFTPLLNGCGSRSSRQEVREDFDLFLNDIFVLEVQSDTLSLNYSLTNPENYGITDKKTPLGAYSVRHMNSDLSATENYLHRLLSFDYTLLTDDQQLTYSILKSYLEQNMDLGKFMYYNECLGPTTGIQAQLPILLAEYNFYDKGDIDEYLRLLPCVYDYFEDIAQYEQEKSEWGLFMNDAVAKRIIKQCKAFIKNPEENFLIEYFNEKISLYEGLTQSEITHYKALNKKAVLNYVIPAYEMLAEELTALLGSGINNAGLYYYSHGKAYYESLVKYKTGSDKSMDGIIELLENAIKEGLVKITTLTMSDKSIVDKYLSFKSFPITDPEKIISDLKKDIVKDFPEAVPVNCEIKYVPKSLSEYLSPAMYLIPPIDSYKNNNIYINGNDSKTLSMIYTTVAHEGYPGHLYQCVYFRNQDPAPIRNLMNFTGYDEGWATYVEMYSYHISGIDEKLAAFLDAYSIIILCMYARADIGIHYEGWTKSRVIDYVTGFIGNDDIAGAIYDTLLEEPAVYLPYAIGYLEIMELREKAEEELGSRFVAKDFHRFLLEIGPAQFNIIGAYMDKWMAEKMK
jgi:uncharacterized protein (DUF885 family)